MLWIEGPQGALRLASKVHTYSDTLRMEKSHENDRNVSPYLGTYGGESTPRPRGI